MKCLLVYVVLFEKKKNPDTPLRMEGYSGPQQVKNYNSFHGSSNKLQRCLLRECAWTSSVNGTERMAAGPPTILRSFSTKTTSSWKISVSSVGWGTSMTCFHLTAAPSARGSWALLTWPKWSGWDRGWVLCFKAPSLWSSDYFTAKQIDTFSFDHRLEMKIYNCFWLITF